MVNGPQVQPDADSGALPSVTVVMPMFQAGDTVGAALSGVLTQSYAGRVQVVVVDDGSTDAGADIARAHGERVTVVHQANAGTAAARNAALAHCDTDLVALCDADDVLLPPYLHTAVRTWQRAGAGRRFVTCNALLLTQGGVAHRRTVMSIAVPAPPRQRLAILEANFVSGFAVMPTPMLRELGGWATGCYLEDWDLWIRAIYAGWQAVPQPVPHALYRWSPASKSTSARDVFSAEDDLLQRVADEREDLVPAERDYLRRRLAGRSPRVLVHEAEQALRVGDTRAARRLFTQAARLSPSNSRLALKSRSLILPGVARMWSRRLAGIDASLQRDTDVAR